MAVSRIRRRWIEAGLIWFPGPHRIRQSVVDFEDDSLSAVFDAKLRFILAFHKWERFHDVVDGVARSGECPRESIGLLIPRVIRTQIKVEEGRVQLAAKQEAA